MHAQGLSHGGGKGGGLMHFTKDGGLLVKELSSDDHNSVRLPITAHKPHISAIVFSFFAMRDAWTRPVGLMRSEGADEQAPECRMHMPPSPAGT